MEDILIKENISKLSYYCQRIYTTINLFDDLVEKREYKLLNDIILRLVDDIVNCLKYYSKISEDISVIYTINDKVELVIEGYNNLDYFYIKDIFKYELLPRIEKIFDEIKEIIFKN